MLGTNALNKRQRHITEPRRLIKARVNKARKPKWDVSYDTDVYFIPVAIRL